MQQTTNYGMNQPEAGDTVDIEDLNENPEILDEKIKEIEDAVTALTERIDDIGGFLAGISGKLTSAQKIAIRNELGVSTPQEAITFRTAFIAATEIAPKGVRNVPVVCPVVEGYTPVGIVGYASWNAESGGKNWGYVTLGNFHLDGTTVTVEMYNTNDHDVAVVATHIVVMYRRNNF